MKAIAAAAGLALALAAAGPGPAVAWNLEARHVGALRYLLNGDIRFTLVRSGVRPGRDGAEFRCRAGSGGQWFYLQRCASRDAACQRRKDRLGEVLLAAKLEGRRVHVQRSGCVVTEVALQP